MPNKIIQLSDETFHQTFLSSYKAVVLFHPNNFSCCFIDTTRKKFIYFFNKNSELPFQHNELEILIQQNFLNKPELEKHILFATPYVHSIPASFEPKENLSKFETMFECKELPDFLTKSLWNIYLHYKVDKDFQEITSQIPNSKCYPHLHSILIQTKYFQQKNKALNVISIHLFHNYIEVVCIKEQQPFLINTFPYQTDDDVMYYIQYIVQTLKYSTNNLLLLFSGKIEKQSELLNQCKKFQLTFHLSNFNHHYIYSYRFNELKPHLHSSLFFLPYENY